ncbi:MAG TPA: crosslink repair DNA glycosylase YcaQ family protein [Solirubrobacteraceae bacterium]|nr:crosslink repair DNA glycosylase YcaQ family protein [Solirubrobacteraceae bacterium]
MALRAQGLLGAPDRKGGVPALLERLGAVQLDTISVLARSHELVAYARLGPVGRDAVENAYWTRPPTPPRAFEYWSHAACVLPIASWPLFAFRRREFRARGRRWHEVPERACEQVVARLRDEGPLTTADLGGGRRGGEWWDWSDVKVAVEWLLDIGEVVCVRREGWRRVYDLAERAVPAPLLAGEPDDETCLRELVAAAGRVIGVGTRADLAEVHRLRGEQVDAVVADAGLVPVEVAGWDAPAWAHPEALDALGASGRPRHRTTLLSPFDSLVWDRPRTRRLFGFEHKIEAYVPRSKRVHGYYAMPLLTGGRLAGRADPARDGTTFVARRVSVEGGATRAMARALGEAAAWVGCDAVRVEQVAPPEAAGPLRAALA